MPTVHLIISGKVQGVFYRATAKEIADQLGVRGWVKNAREGHVEIMANGNAAAIQRFIAWCRQGPPKAIVDDVSIAEQEEMQFTGFAVLRQ
jgi:acylphosphatase